MECLEAQCQEHLEGIWNFSHTKFLCCIKLLSRTPKDDFSMQPERKVFGQGLVWTWPLINRICGFGGRNLQRTSTKKAITEGKSPFGLSCPNTVKSAKAFIRTRTHAVWPIFADAPERLLDTRFGKRLASTDPRIYARWCQAAYCKSRAALLNTDYGHRVMSTPFSGLSKLRQILAASQPWPESLRLFPWSFLTK